MRTGADLVADLRALGVHPGDRLMVHASLRRIGPVAGDPVTGDPVAGDPVAGDPVAGDPVTGDPVAGGAVAGGAVAGGAVAGGAVAVVAAIDEAIGPDGTWLMVLGAADDHAWVNERPESERAALLAGATPFDSRTTPALPEVGVLAEVMRTSPGTLVNDHPEGRFAARGRLAEQWLADLPWDDYYGPGSALDRFVTAGGQVLRMGADPDTVTVLHHAEYLADVPETLRVRRHRLVVTPEGPRIVVVECLDDEDGIVPLDRQPTEDYFAVILREFLATHPHRKGRVGDAEAELIDAADLVRFGSAWMTANLR